MKATGNFASNGDGCDAWWALLSAHADGETDAREAREVEAHVAACERCARELAGLKRFSVVLGGLTPIEPPPGLQSAILARTLHRVGIAARIRNAFRVPQVQWASMAAAGAAAALLYSFFQPRVPIEPTRISDRTTSGASKPLTARVDKARPNEPVNVKPIVPAIVPQQEQRVARNEPEKKHELGGLIIPAKQTIRPQPAAPGFAVAYRPARMSRPKPIFEAKPNSTALPSATDDMAAMVSEAEGKIADASDMAEKNAPAVPTPSAAVVAPARIQLVSASGGISPGQIATLAGLKKELQSQRITWNTQSVKDSLRDKQLRVDVIRGTF